MTKQEIEIKFQISSSQFSKLKKWLEKNAKYKGENRQIDYYLDHPKNRLTFKNKDGIKDAEDYFRVRITPKGDSTCLKCWKKDPKRPGQYTHCDEHETDVEDGKILLNLYKALGHEITAKVDKTRRTYRYKSLEIEVDKVRGVGVFVEIELKRQVRNVQAGREMIYDLLREIGIRKITFQNRGYVSMIWNPKYDFGEILELKKT